MVHYGFCLLSAVPCHLPFVIVGLKRYLFIIPSFRDYNSPWKKFCSIKRCIPYFLFKPSIPYHIHSLILIIAVPHTTHSNQRYQTAISNNILGKKGKKCPKHTAGYGPKTLAPETRHTGHDDGGCSTCSRIRGQIFSWGGLV